MTADTGSRWPLTGDAGAYSVIWAMAGFRTPDRLQTLDRDRGFADEPKFLASAARLLDQGRLRRNKG